MFHSSLFPIAFILSLVIGIGAFNVCRDSMHMAVADSVSIAAWVAGIVNVVIGLPKNLILGDVLSLIFVRPLSAGAVIGIVHPVAASG